MWLAYAALVVAGVRASAPSSDLERACRAVGDGPRCGAVFNATRLPRACDEELAALVVAEHPGTKMTQRLVRSVSSAAFVDILACPMRDSTDGICCWHDAELLH